MDRVAQPRAGLRIRDFRLAAGLTQRQLADAAGVSVTVVRDLEQGVTHTPRASTLALLADALGTTPAGLTGGDDGLTEGDGAPLGLADSRSVRVGVTSTARRARAAELALHSIEAWYGNDLRLRVLGPLAAWRGNMALALGPPRDRAVLAMLALHPGQLVHRDALIAVIWQLLPPPATAVAMIQNAVSRLRHSLAPPGAPAVLATAGSRYQLVPGRVDLDLATYSSLADAAGEARRRGNRPAAWSLYDQALALWADDPAADVELLRDAPVLTGLRARHASMIADYAEDASNYGHHARVLPYLLALTERDPFDERAHACLMIAQAGMGNKAEALGTYDRVRTRLDADGMAPGEQLRSAQTRILRGELVYRPMDVLGRVAGGRAPRRNLPSGVPLTRVLLIRISRDIVGAEYPVTLCDLGIFVDQAAESVPPQDLDIRVRSGRTVTPGGRALAERPVRAMNVIVLDVLAKNQPQVPFAGDQHLVQALAAGAGDPSFGGSVAPHRQLRPIRIIGTSVPG